LRLEQELFTHRGGLEALNRLSCVGSASGKAGEAEAVDNFRGHLEIFPDVVHEKAKKSRLVSVFAAPCQHG
jgi:hypothetical protein